jgi:phosphate transport system permease protein
MGDVAVGSDHYHALFGLAVVLLIIALIVNLSAVAILSYLRDGRNAGPARSPRFKSPFYSSLKNKFDQWFRIVALVLLILLLLSAGLWWAALAVVLAAAAWHYGRDRLSQKYIQTIAFAVITAAALIVLAILAIILGDIIINGFPALSWDFLTQAPSNLGRSGGIFPAIVGTLYLVTGAILIALPIGVGAAIYLVEYTREGRITKLIRTGVDLLNGTPSIVFGLFGFAFLVLFLKIGVSLLAGMITLALMVLPTVIRTTEESLKNVPQSLREGSLALGATQWQTIRKVVIPPAIPGIVTGAILSIGRAAGETAPIMFVAVVFSTRFLPNSLFEPVMALPYHLYILSTNVPNSSTNRYGTALVLLMLVVAFYSVAILIRSHYAKKARG